MKTVILTIPMIITLGILSLGCAQSPADEFLPEDVAHSIPLNQICNGGPDKDGLRDGAH